MVLVDILAFHDHIYHFYLQEKRGQHDKCPLPLYHLRRHLAFKLWILTGRHAQCGTPSHIMVQNLKCIDPFLWNGHLPEMSVLLVEMDSSTLYLAASDAGYASCYVEFSKHSTGHIQLIPS